MGGNFVRGLKTFIFQKKTRQPEIVIWTSNKRRIRQTCPKTFNPALLNSFANFQKRSLVYPYSKSANPYPHCLFANVFSLDFCGAVHSRTRSTEESANSSHAGHSSADADESFFISFYLY